MVRPLTVAKQRSSNTEIRRNSVTQPIAEGPVVGLLQLDGLAQILLVRSYTTTPFAKELAYYRMKRLFLSQKWELRLLHKISHSSSP